MNNDYSTPKVYLFITMLTSSVVLIEPSPYDLFMALFLAMILLSAHFTLNKTILVPIILSLIFLLTNLISMFFVQNPTSTITYFIITCYLVGTFIVLLGFSQKANAGISYIILGGYYYAAVLATIIGIFAYFNLLPSNDLFLMFGRVKSTFKDPNVFGPFLVIPSLYALSLIEGEGRKLGGKLFHFLMFILLVIGIIISFSRAAWGNFAISLFLYLVIMKKEMIIVRIRTIISIVVIAIPVFFVLIQSPAIEELLSSRLTIKNYDSDRFGTQMEAFIQGVNNLLGMGPGQSEIVFQYSPHSLYARVFTENGLIGLLSIISLILLSARQSYMNFRSTSDMESTIYIILFSTLVGLAFNSFFIDTLHWRHLWIVLALAWFPVKKENLNGRE